MNHPQNWRRGLASAKFSDHQGGVDRRIVALVFACFSACQLALQAQDFKLFGRDVDVHGFASQGFVYTNVNNWLTMNSSQGSGAFTDFGVNVSTNVTDKLRVGAQFYDRNLGQLGQYHPSLDWAVVDYRFKSWFGVRGGKVKTTLGLHNDHKTWIFSTVLSCFPKVFIPSISAMPRLLIWAATSTEIFHSRSASAIFSIRHTPGIAVTAFTAVTPTFCRNTEPASRALAGFSTAPISAGARR